MRRGRTPGQTTRDGYGARHARQRAALLAGDPPCHHCGATATHADHVPPLDLAARLLGVPRADAALLYTTDGTGPYQLLPACAPCNLRAGARYATAKRRAGLPPVPPAATGELGTSRPW